MADGYIHRAKSVSGEEMQSGEPSHVFSHCSEWDCELALEYGKSDVSQKMGNQNPAIDIQTKKMKAGEDRVEYRKRTSGKMRAKWRKMKLTNDGREERRAGVEERGFANLRR